MPILLIGIAVVIFDQYAKYYIQSHMSVGTSIPVITHVFHITYILNPGAAFGILQYQTAFFVIIGMALVVSVAYFYQRVCAEKLLLRVGIGLLAGGAVGNLIDRIHTGYVVDFFDFRIWPVFNIADIAIVCGVGCVIYNIAVQSDSKGEKND